MFKERMTRPTWLALCLALIGTACTIGSTNGGQPLGIALAVLSAVIYAVYIAAGSRVTHQVSALVTSTVIMAAASVVYGCLVAVRGFHVPSTLAGWSAIIAIALISTVLAG